MKKSWILLTACAALLSGVEAIACTGLLVGKKYLKARIHG